MKVSLNWIRYYQREYRWSADPAPDGIDALVEKIGAQLGAVEEVIDLGELYEDIVVAKVISSEKHPNADKLSVCMIDTGKAKPIQVVCGAPNVAAGQKVVWIPPGATVPSTVGKDPFVLEAKELRGVVSHGMIASAKELALGEDHNGILVLDGSAKPGEPVAKVLELDDYIIDIENKMFTHRPDCFGMLGIAREIAGIQHQAFKSPSWYKEDVSLFNDGRKNVMKLEVKNQVPKLVPRFCAIAIKDVKVEPSPAWLQSYLARLGVRPINNIVDITNYYMLLTGQPLHAYDYDKVATGTLGARLSKADEELKLLGGKIIKLKDGAVVITDGSKPIGLGGVMGGAETEVSAETRNIIVEVATFDMNLTRKTAFEYGLFTDAATRFTKNQSPRQNLAVLCKAVGDIKDIAGGRVASKTVDVKGVLPPRKSVQVTVDFVNSRLGLDLTAGEISKLLTNVEFKVVAKGGQLGVEPPFWRMDIEIPEDIVEEAGRLYGYEHLPMVLPERLVSPAQVDALISLKSRLRQVLSRAGANEILTYSFVNGRLLEAVGQEPKNSYHIRNSLSPDLQYYRQGLMPSLLEKVQQNVRQGYDELALFEIGKIHFKGMHNDESLPAEPNHLALVVAAKNGRPGAAYFWAKQICDFLLEELNVSARYEALAKETSPKATYYELSRTSEIKSKGKILGRVGEFKPSITRALKLPPYCAGFSVHLDDLLPLVKDAAYRPLNKYPETEQDFCLRTSAGPSYNELADFMDTALAKLVAPHGYEYSLRALDIFQKPGDPNHKQTTWRIVLSHPERTLTTVEVNKLLDELAAIAKSKLRAERI